MKEIPHLNDYTFVGIDTDLENKLVKVNLIKDDLNNTSCTIICKGTKTINEVLFTEGKFPDNYFRYIDTNEIIDNGDTKTHIVYMMNGAIIKITAEEFEYEEH